jgi:hypothetical protein
VSFSSSPKASPFVASTESTILDLLVPSARRIAVQLEPPAGQNLTARVKVALSSDATPALTTFPDFAEPFGSSRVGFLDVDAAQRVVIVGELDGAGGTVSVWVRYD